MWWKSNEKNEEIVKIAEASRQRSSGIYFQIIGWPKNDKKYENLIHSSENFLSFIWQTTEPTIEIDHFIENDGQTVERIEEAEKRIIEEWKKSKSIESTSKWKVNDVDEWSKQTTENGCRWWCFFFWGLNTEKKKRMKQLPWVNWVECIKKSSSTKRHIIDDKM